MTMKDMKMKDVKIMINAHHSKDSRQNYTHMLKAEDPLDVITKYISIRNELSEARAYLINNARIAPENRTLLGAIFPFTKPYLYNDSKRITSLEELIETLDEVFSEGLERNIEEGDLFLYKDNYDDNTSCLRVLAYQEGTGYTDSTSTPVVEKVDPAKVLCTLYPGGSYTPTNKLVPVIYKSGEIIVVGIAAPKKDKIMIQDQYYPSNHHIREYTNEESYHLRTLRPARM